MPTWYNVWMEMEIDGYVYSELFGKLSYGKVLGIKMQDTTREMFHFYDVELDAKVAGAEIYRTQLDEAHKSFPDCDMSFEEEDIFLMSIDPSPAYFHLLYDMLFQYEILKEEYPQIKIKMVHAFAENEYFFKLLDRNAPVLRDIMKLYGITEKDILPHNNTVYHFKKTYNILFAHNYVYRPFMIEKWGEPDHFGPPGYNARPHKNYPNEHRDFFVRARNLFMKRVFKGFNIKKNSSQKIYVARKPDGNNERGTSTFNKNIEKYFKSKGYEVVYNEGLGLREQVERYYNATHIAGLKGSNFVNMVFCRQNVKIICICPNNYFNVWYDQVASYLSLSYIEAPSNIVYSRAENGIKKEEYSYKKVIASLELEENI